MIIRFLTNVFAVSNKEQMLILVMICLGLNSSLIYADDAVISNVLVQNDPGNSLRIIVSWDTSIPADSMVKYRKAADNESTWMSTPLYSDQVTGHEVTVVGLHELTEYMVIPVSGGVDGPETSIFTQGISQYFPVTQLAVTDNESNDGITIGGFPWPISSIIAVDNQGEIIWYHTDSEGGDAGDFTIGWDGRLYYNTINAIKAVDFAGNEETLFSSEKYGEDIHHDFLITPEGSYMYLSHKTYPGISLDWCVDEIVERDYAGKKIWSWNLGDYSSQLGGFVISNGQQFSQGEGCDRDWSHSNSLFIDYDSFNNKYIILSIRNLNRIIKIDYATGAIVWQLGEGLDFSYIGDESEALRWFYYQHSASILPGGELLLFDNGNERYVDQSKNVSRALIYSLDESSLTAKISWSYNFPAMADHSGNAFLIDNGNVLITFPTDSSRLYSAFVEVNGLEEVVWQTDLIYSGPNIQNFLLGNLRISSLYDLTSQTGSSAVWKRNSGGGSDQSNSQPDRSEDPSEISSEEVLEKSTDSRCFIATAAFGPSDSRLDVLRKFRDDWLIKTSFGKSFIAFYYRVSPSIAVHIKKHRLLQMVTRTSLIPIIFFLQFPLVTLELLCIFLTVFVVVRSGEKER